MKRNIVLKLAYDGSSFFGWQKTARGPTIEEALEAALFQILQEPIELQAASRTDRGVHAEGQYVNFFTNKNKTLEEIQCGANALLPNSIRVLSIMEAPLFFHPTLHAEIKEYHYHVNYCPVQLPKDRFYAWHVPYPLDLRQMEAASRYFLGEHDFSSFCNMRKNLNYTDKHRRIESISITQPEEGMLLFAIRGENFLYKMVRTIVGTLIYVGLGKLKARAIPIILTARSRPLAGMTAPAHGLTLKKIEYMRSLSYSLPL